MALTNVNNATQPQQQPSYDAPSYDAPSYDAPSYSEGSEGFYDAPSYNTQPQPPTVLAEQGLVAGRPVKQGIEGLLEEAGITGLNLNLSYGALPLITLDKGRFKILNGEDFSGNAFSFHVISSKWRLTIACLSKKVKGGLESWDIVDKATDLLYIYPPSETVINGAVVAANNQLITSKGVALDIALEELSSMYPGCKFRRTLYQEVCGVLESEGHTANGQMCLLAIPPASQAMFSRLALQFATQKVLARRKAKQAGEVPVLEYTDGFLFSMKISVGPENKSGAFSFFPWQMVLLA